MKSVIIGTAGHVDHGKSALVEALTGTHPDRLPEEKKRGITLDLGFAFLDLGETRIGFVDVPGHERFVRNMLAGASGFDLVLLVVAADNSIRPQTREHFDICRLLAIPRGVVAVTKADLVDTEALELVRLEVTDFVRGSFLEGAPIVSVSTKSGIGIARLRLELARVAAEAPKKRSARYFRLPIDRAFLINGVGTVVTGTLISGEVRPEDEVELFPSRRRVRVRGVESAGVPMDRATAGQRTALNLAGVDLHEVGRGMVLAAPGRFVATSQLDARVTLLPSASPLKHRAKVHFHHGTMETVAEVFLLDGAVIMPGDAALVQLRLVKPVLVLPGDRFILRRLSPVVTIGGGVVLDAAVKRHRSQDRAAVLDLLRRLERNICGDADECGSSERRADVLAALVSGVPGSMTLESLVARTGWLEPEIRAAARGLAVRGILRIVSGQPGQSFVVAPVAAVEACASRILAELDDFHQTNPLIAAISKESLRKRTAAAVHPDVFRAALSDLVLTGRVGIAGDVVRREDRSLNLMPEEAQPKQEIERQFVQSGLSAPEVGRVLAGLPVDQSRAEKLLQLLLRERILIRISEELVFHSEAVKRLRECLAEYKRTRGANLPVGEFKQLTGVSRKYAIPLLEYLDREHVTRREGDSRVIL
jgi:selenocysteine-specific elongation factor